MADISDETAQASDQTAPTSDEPAPAPDDTAQLSPEDAVTAAIAGGNHDETSLTDQEFQRRHPELAGTKLGKNDHDLAQEWLDIRNNLVRPALAKTHDEAAAACPAQLRLIKGSGYEGSGGGRVADALARLRSQKGLMISDGDIDMFQRIAEVETSGHLTSINSWDSAVLSAGFMQWTLRFGELAKWIQTAPEAFGRHGIELDQGQYCIGQDKCTAIKGAASCQELRQLPWAVRFAQATVDDDVVIAQVRMALDSELPRQVRAMKARVEHGVPGGWDLIAPYYERSSLVRALLHEAYNNRPAYAQTAALSIAKALNSSMSDDDFVKLVATSIVNAYANSSESGAVDKGRRLTTAVQRPALYCSDGASA
jgi:hypothetical protein